MTKKKQKLLDELARIKREVSGDIEAAHGLADDAILSYINDQEIESAYADIPKWYA